MLYDTSLSGELSGLTKLQLACMEQNISLHVLGEMTRIPPPLLSNYALGKRSISRHHYPILAIALDETDLRGLATPTQVYVDEHEISEHNPLPARAGRRLLPYPKTYSPKRRG